MSCLILKRIVNKDEHLRNLLREADVDLELVCALIRGSSTPEFVVRSHIFVELQRILIC